MILAGDSPKGAAGRESQDPRRVGLMGSGSAQRRLLAAGKIINLLGAANPDLGDLAMSTLGSLIVYYARNDSVGILSTLAVL